MPIFYASSRPDNHKQYAFIGHIPTTTHNTATISTADAKSAIKLDINDQKTHSDDHSDDDSDDHCFNTCIPSTLCRSKCNKDLKHKDQLSP